MAVSSRKRRAVSCVWYTLFGLGLYFVIRAYTRTFILPEPSQADLLSSSELQHDREFEDEVGNKLFNVPLSKSLQKRSVLITSSEDSGCLLHRPALQDIMFSHTYWQTLKTNHLTMYLYGAYLDTRKSTHIVKILMVSEEHISKKFQEPQFCRYWANDGSTVYSSIAEVKAVHYLWRENWGLWGSLHPYLVFCRIPPYKGVNASTAWESVSLTDSRCKDDISHDLRIRYSPPSPKKKSFGVCIKGLSYPKRDMSRRLIEWMEMNRILGAEGFHFSVFHVHHNVEKVLDHYIKLGLATKKYTTLPGSQPVHPVETYKYMKKNVAQTWKQELITYNDCYFSHLHEYEYITPLDIDEVILPTEVDNWGELYKKLLAKNNTELTTPRTTPDQDKPDIVKVRPLRSLCLKMFVFINRLVDPVTGRHIHPPDTDYGDVEPGVGMEYVNEREGTLEEEPFMMQRVHYINPESTAVQDQSYKCFHHTGNPEINAIWNHGPQICRGKQGKRNCALDLEENLGYVHHHREKCCDYPAHLDAIVHPSDIFFFNDRILFAKEKLQARSREMYDTIFSDA